MHRSPHRLALAVLLLAGCTRNITFDAAGAQRLQRVAIVVRTTGAARGDLTVAQRGSETPEGLGKKIESAMSAYELSERVRSGLIEHLPDAPPWNTIIPSVQAETVLGDLLTVDKTPKPPNFDELQRLGVDGVLFVQIERWGVRGDDTGQSGYVIEGTGRFMTLPDHDTLWQGGFGTAGSGPLESGWAAPGLVRDALGSLAARSGEELALQLGGSPQSVQKTPALEAPDIEDKGHPPEKRPAVLPFVLPERDGGAGRDAGGGIDISFADGGDLPPGGR